MVSGLSVYSAAMDVVGLAAVKHNSSTEPKGFQEGSKTVRAVRDVKSGPNQRG